MKGVETIRPDRVCSGSLKAIIDEAFKLVEYRFVWLPDVQVKFLQAYNQIQKEYNTAFVYCKFNQLWASISALFQPGSEDAQGRMISRIVSAMAGDWWYHTNCIIDGFLGDNYYDVGFCMGKLTTVVFDVTIG